ncbi:MAG: phage major capsid protein [Pseudomonadota bacterium]
MPLDDAALQPIHEAVDALRKSAETHGENSAEAKTIAENAKKELDALADANTKANVEINAVKDANEALEQRLKDLEAEVVRKSVEDPENYKKSAEYKALHQYAKVGEARLDGEARKTLRTDDNTSGGYLVMPEMENQLQRNVTEISPVRQESRVRTTSSKTLMVPRRESIPTAAYEGEAAAAEESEPKYASSTLTAHRLSFTAVYTQDMLVDSAFDLEAELSRDAAEAFAQAEGRGFVLGNGSQQPQGFLSQPKLNTAFNASTNPLGYVTTSSSAAVTADDLLKLTGELKTGYDPVFAFNRRTMATFLQFKGTDGQYLFDFGNLAAGRPSNIRGYRIAMFEDMPDITANSFSVVFGDFRRGFLVTDRTGLQVIRDEVTAGGSAIVKLHFHRWNTGQVVVPEAIRLLRTQA